MWGQIDGEAKISIAKTVVGQVLDDLPKTRRLGLVAYGHNREGDCTDIEEIAPIGTERDAIRRAVDGIDPKGKTPLSASVQFAAEKLHYTENKATVILVSEGRETCDLDPCAVGNALEQAGVDFTAHVIGFDVVEQSDQEQLQCLADNTGGKYLNAGSAEELSRALEQTVAEVPLPEADQATLLSLRATDLAQGPEIESGLVWRVVEVGGGAEVFAASDAGAPEVEVAPGINDIFVEWPSEGLSGSAETIQVELSREKTITIALEQDFDASLRMAPAVAPAGAKFLVDWTGPQRKDDWIAITQVDGTPSSFISFEYVATGGNPAELRMPAQPGKYQVRYVLGQPARVLASLEVEATAVSAALEAPDTVAAGANFDVNWTGPGYQDDWVTVVEPEAEAKAYLDFDYMRVGEVASLKAPLEPGEYELRYVQEDKEVLATRTIMVTAVTATVTGPKTAEVGSQHDVVWTGPGGEDDWLTVVETDTEGKAYNDFAYTRDGEVLTLKMPLEPGAYELRYVQGDNKVLATQPITITDLEVTISAPSTAAAGSSVQVGFDGPGWHGDWLTVVLPSDTATSYNDYANGRDGSPVELIMPDEPGDYELRYVLDGERVVGRKSITVR